MRRELKSPLKEEIQDLRDQCNVSWEKGSYADCAEFLLKAWDKLPAPKGEYPESFHISRSLCEAFLFLNDHINAKKWSEEIYSCGLHRIDSGEREFLSGKVAFAMHDLTSSKHFFAIANKKSEGRCFQNEDKKYKNLLSKKDIRPTEFNALFDLSVQEYKTGNFSYALSLLYDCLNIQQMDPKVHLQKGKCHFELGEPDHAADSLTRAYMLGGIDTFKGEEPKYLEFLKTKIKI